jgi:hypothetical protein
MDFGSVFSAAHFDDGAGEAQEDISALERLGADGDDPGGEIGKLRDLFEVDATMKQGLGLTFFSRPPCRAVAGRLAS